MTAGTYSERAREVLDEQWTGSDHDDNGLILWAAGQGAYEVIEARLGRWLPDATVPVTRETREAALRIARAAATPAHLAVVTYLEESLGILVPRDELLARALTDRDAESVNWERQTYSVANRLDTATSLRWAVARLADPDPDVRRFAATVAHWMSFNEPPGAEEAIAALRIRLPVEPDAGVLVELIGAFAEYHGGGELPEIVAHAGHADARVRRMVAAEMQYALPAAAATEVLAFLGRDQDADVRATALRVIRDHLFDHPVTRELIAAGREDPDHRVRLEALAGLARSGDAEACAELRRLGDEAGEGSPVASMADAAQAWLRKARECR
ncbi:HEAT repeat domain-containing protein [Actinoplanes sp. NPDC023801]|uniref:HEAT repeat domain-containing protein n=1 Tax=Actinoplanes sp. NPDC023801 TaxID=3154595 RepID=UPI0033FEBD67